ncbi:MAG TPA: FxsA family protein [Thiopseudomonas sp.]|nr:FxsA family protein [Thiopseudomonas sp.]
MRGFFLLFLIFPLLELFVLIRVGSSIGASSTLLLVLASGVLGVLCIRLAGLATALKVRERMALGETPNKDMLNGLLLVVAGGLLFLPGFISDTVGLLGLLPVTRHWLINRISRHMTHTAQKQQYYRQSTTYTRYGEQQETRQEHIIEGEFERKDP